MTLEDSDAETTPAADANANRLDPWREAIAYEMADLEVCWRGIRGGRETPEYAVFLSRARVMASGMKALAANHQRTTVAWSSASDILS